MELGTIDWIFLGMTASMATVGLFRGISGEIARLLGLLAAVVALVVVCWPAREFVVACVPVGNPILRLAAVGGIALGAATMSFVLARKASAAIISVVVPQPFNALLGCVAGAAKGFLVAALALTVVTWVAPRVLDGDSIPERALAAIGFIPSETVPTASEPASSEGD